jgi:hypothetical protein
LPRWGNVLSNISRWGIVLPVIFDVCLYGKYNLNINLGVGVWHCLSGRSYGANFICINHFFYYYKQFAPMGQCIV